MEKEKPLILIAEDYPDNFKLLKILLCSDYRILYAQNGQEAIDLFKQYTPALILMDIKMPVKDGYEATAEIRALSLSVPIIALTAYAFATDEHRILNSGFDSYISKPINARILKEKIQTILEK